MTKKVITIQRGNLREDMVIRDNSTGRTLVIIRATETIPYIVIATTGGALPTVTEVKARSIGVIIRKWMEAG